MRANLLVQISDKKKEVKQAVLYLKLLAPTVFFKEVQIYNNHFKKKRIMEEFELLKRS